MVSKADGQTLELTAKAFELQVPNVLESVAKLMIAAAEHAAKEANNGSLWG
ncbi:hypothetical protein D3C85_691560 [compost metagenome]